MVGTLRISVVGIKLVNNELSVVVETDVDTWNIVVGAVNVTKIVVGTLWSTVVGITRVKSELSVAVETALAVTVGAVEISVVQIVLSRVISRVSVSLDSNVLKIVCCVVSRIVRVVVVGMLLTLTCSIVEK